MTTMAQAQGTMNQKVIGGVVGGLVGGVVFGAMMAMMGMLPMIGSLVGSSSAVVGFIVHIVMFRGNPEAPQYRIEPIWLRPADSTHPQTTA